MLRPSRRAILALLATVGLVSLADRLAAQPPPDTKLPKVVLVGDSIRLSYATLVRQQLHGQAVVVSPAGNGGDSKNLLARIEPWVIAEKPDIVQFNCGIHDTKKFKTSGKFQVSPEDYEANLRQMVERIRAKTDATVIFATTTPILDDRAAKTRSERDYELLNASIEQYNAIARKVMAELDVPINDLNQALTQPEGTTKTADLIGSDGVHLTPLGQKLLGEKVGSFIAQHIDARELEATR